ncbi:BldC family transcriptional regulator [Streptosporangium sp. NPDC001559]|uniref:BldC family transcriptional regulator n=1 Tax=Streptosporangium sp. NPDC001559 TaxID=3366187 RepID=UPI0036E0A946
MSDAPDRLLTPKEVAALFGVDPKTVSRWALAGKLTSFRTLGGHRRFREAEILAHINPTPTQAEEV